MTIDQEMLYETAWEVLMIDTTEDEREALLAKHGGDPVVVMQAEWPEIWKETLLSLEKDVKEMEEGK